MKVVVLADTHLRGGLDRLPAEVVAALRQCDAILHAGDVTSHRALDELRAFGAVHAVLGNNDADLVGRLPVEIRIELAGVRIAMVHDSGPAKGRAARLSRRYPDARIVVFGHSHVPLVEMGNGDQLLFNPGSPTQRRLQPHPTYGRLRLEQGEVVAREIVALGSGARPLDPPAVILDVDGRFRRSQ